MNYKNQYQRKAHQEIDFIFLTLLPQAGLSVREEQVKLSHQMLDTLLEGKIALCDAGVGIGKTYAYLVACVLMRKYAAAMGNGWVCDKRPVVISTSSIALQEAIIQEYIPFLSDIFLATGLIGSPLKAIVRKGKEHFVCDNRLEVRLEAVRDKPKNEAQKKALFSLKQISERSVPVLYFYGTGKRPVREPESVIGRTDDCAKLGRRQKGAEPEKFSRLSERKRTSGKNH